MQEELARRKGLDKAKKGLVNALIYHKMYNSEACWKVNPKVVVRKLRRLNMDGNKYEALKQTLVFKWMDLVGMNSIYHGLVNVLTA